MKSKIDNYHTLKKLRKKIEGTLMKKIIYLILIMFACNLVASSPHPVMIELQTSSGNLPDQEGISFQAWRSGHPDVVLDLTSTDCYYPAFGIYLHINCGSFAVWNPGDTLHVEVFDDIDEEWYGSNFVLNEENMQTFDIGDGGMTLGVRFDLPEQTGFRYYDGLIFDLAPYITYLWDDDYIISVDGNEHILVDVDDMILQLSSNGSWFGTESLLVTINDNNRSVSSDSIMVEVYPNHAPEFNFPENGFSFSEDEELTIDLLEYISDYENDDLTFSVSDYNELICTVTNNNLSISAPENWNGEETIMVQAEDGQLRISSSENVQISVIPVNDPPQLTFPNSIGSDEDAVIIIPISEVIYDVEDDSLYISTESSEHIELTISDNEMNFIPEENWFGSESMIISVFDQTETVLDTIMFNIAAVNDPPFISLPEYHTFAGDQPMNIDFSEYIYDVDNSDLTLTAESDNMEILIDNFYVTFTAIDNWHGSEDITFTVSDNVQRLSTSDTIRINCFLLEDSIIDISDANIDETDYMEININTSEIFDHWSVSSYEMTLYYDPYFIHYFGNSLNETIASGGNVTLTVDEDTNPAQIQISYNHYLPLTGEGSILKLWFQAMCFGEVDLYGEDFYYNNQQIADPLPGNIVINDIGITNHVPRADAGDSITINAGEEGSLDASLSWDPDNGELTYLWNLPEGFEVDDLTSINPTFTAPVVDSDTDFEILLTVTDPDMNIDTDEVEITVLYQNFPPQIELPQLIEYNEDETISEDFQQYIEDLNGDTLILTANESEHISIDIDDFMVTFSADANWFGDEMIYFTVSDDITRLSAIDSIVVSVLPVNDPPVAEAGDDLTLRDGGSGILDAGSSYDIDNETLSYYWQAGENILLDDPEAEICGFTTAECDSLVSEIVYLTVDDLQNRATGLDSLMITIIDDEVRYLQALNLSEGDVELSWTEPYAYNPEVNYNIYIDGTYSNNIADTLVVINTEAGIHEFGIAAVYNDGLSDIISVELEVTGNSVDDLPMMTRLNEIYPNPFNPETTVVYQLSRNSQVVISVYNIKGQRVAELINDQQEAGDHSVVWDAGNQASGIYFLKMKADEVLEIRKLILMK